MSLSFDEIKIKSEFVYKNGTGKSIVFTDMGDVNDEIKNLINEIEDKGENHDFAWYINVFLVRRIFQSYASRLVTTNLWVSLKISCSRLCRKPVESLRG